jgi:hypothetical protein
MTFTLVNKNIGYYWKLQLGIESRRRRRRRVERLIQLNLRWQSHENYLPKVAIFQC